MSCDDYKTLREAARRCGLMATMVLDRYVLIDMAARKTVGAYPSVQAAFDALDNEMLLA
jgi:hypothetical protein